MLRSPQLEFLVEAHNGLSARIVEETGFRGIWGSIRTLRFDDLLRHFLAAVQAIRVLYIVGHRLDVDHLEDPAAAQAFCLP